MVSIEMEISNELSTAYTEAVSVYNAKQDPPTSYTREQKLRRLLRRFTKDTLRAKRIEAASDAAEEELKDL